MLILHHAPKSRSFRALWLLEELGLPYTVKLQNIKRADGSGGVSNDYRSINPHGKVPSIEHDGHVVLESAAICLYLSDAFPEAKLGPKVGEDGRADFVSWLFYLAADFEPALAAKALRWQGIANAVADPIEVITRITDQIEQHEWLVCERFTAADVMLAAGLHWGVHVFKAMDGTPAIERYLARCAARPAFQRATSKDQHG